MTPIEKSIEALEKISLFNEFGENTQAGIARKTLAALRAQPTPPPECQTEGEKTAYAFGWWKGIESVRMAQLDHSELVKRLRHTASKGVSVWGDLMIDAADALEGKP